MTDPQSSSRPVGRWKLLASFKDQDAAYEFTVKRDSERPVLVRKVHVPPAAPQWNVYVLTGDPLVRNGSMRQPSTNPKGAAVPSGSRAESQTGDAS